MTGILITSLNSGLDISIVGCSDSDADITETNQKKTKENL
jgi:hypothetical protein